MSRCANGTSKFIFCAKSSPAARTKVTGIQVARLAGLPKEILARAKEILAHLEKPGRRNPNRPSENRGEKKASP